MGVETRCVARGEKISFYRRGRAGINIVFGPKYRYLDSSVPASELGLLWVYETVWRIRIMLLTLIRIQIRLFGTDPDPCRFNEVKYGT
jgi:hypothetical protein